MESIFASARISFSPSSFVPLPIFSPKKTTFSMSPPTLRVSSKNGKDGHDFHFDAEGMAPIPFSQKYTSHSSLPKMGSGGTTFTVDDVLISQGFGYFQILVLAYAGMGWISEATEMMLLSFVGPSVQAQWNLSSHEESLITSVVFVGMLIGAYSWGIVSDNYGRRQLREMLDLLVHAAQCRSPDCKYPNCNKFRAFFRHSNICKTRASGGCFHCKKIWCILQLHARACKASNCKVPRCRDLKKHFKRLQQQSDSRRRASMMEMIRQRAAELGNN